VFAGRDSTGVRGVRLAAGDSVISMAILRAVPATPAERTAYLKHAKLMRTAAEGEEGEETPAVEEDETDAEDQVSLTPGRIAELGAAEEIILTVSTEGFGKRTSAYEFRRTGRGGQGLIAQDLTKKGGRLAASFPVDESDQMLMVTDQGQLIRAPVRKVRLASRNTQGVIVFRTADNEHVVSVERLADTGEDDAEGLANGEVGGEGGEPDTDSAPDTPEA
jgi:DNA gyrase subunit A